jgi:hypothetical protein
MHAGVDSRCLDAGISELVMATNSLLICKWLCISSGALQLCLQAVTPAGKQATKLLYCTWSSVALRYDVAFNWSINPSFHMSLHVFCYSAAYFAPVYTHTKLLRFISDDVWGSKGVCRVISRSISAYLVQAWDVRDSCKHNGAVLPLSAAPVGRGADGVDAMA